MTSTADFMDQTVSQWPTSLRGATYLGGHSAMKRTHALLHILEIWLAMKPFVLVGVHRVPGDMCSGFAGIECTMNSPESAIDD